MSLHRVSMATAFALAMVSAAGALAAAQDEIVLTSGIKIRGEVLSVTEESVTAKVQGNEMSWRLDKVHSVTSKGETKTYAPLVERAKPASGTDDAGDQAAAGPGEKPKPASRLTRKPDPVRPRARDKTDADAIARKAGSENPSWWDAVKVEGATGLNLRDVTSRGQGSVLNHIQTVIMPNPIRHAEGVKLLHDCLAAVKGEAAQEASACDALGEHCARLLADWPRSLYWWQEAMSKGPATKERDVGRAAAYTAMGVTDEAAAICMPKYSPGQGWVFEPVKTAMDLTGDHRLALELGQKLSASLQDREMGVALLTMAGVAREGRDYQAATGLFNQVQGMSFANQRDNRWLKFRASKEAEVMKSSMRMNLARVADGSYTGSSKGYVADVKMTVTVKNRAIASVAVADHRENRALTSLQDVPKRIVDAQDVHVDATTGATVTSYAVMIAVAEALAGATR